MSRLLQIVGALALFAWTAAGVGAWALTKEQVQVTIADGAAAARDAEDPTAALAERIGGLEEDIRALAAALGANLQVLDENLGNAAAARDAALREQLADRAAAAQRQDVATRAALADARRAIDALREEFRAAAAAHPPTAAVLAAGSDPGPDAAPPAPASGTELPPTAEPGDPAVAAEADPAPHPDPGSEVEPAAPPQKKSFLAFRLPSDSFRFEGPRGWQIIPSLSRVGFDAKSTLHDFTGATTKVEGSIRTDLAAPDRGSEGSIRADAAALDTGLDDRNLAMREHLSTAEHPRIEFRLESFEVGEVDAAGMSVQGTATGRMSIRGVTRDFAMPVRMQVDASRRLKIDGEAGLRMSDYGVVVPSKLGMISVTDEVRVWIALRARPEAGEVR
jgi:polyisoprenoid-binding protein YceI